MKSSSPSPTRLAPALVLPLLTLAILGCTQETPDEPPRWNVVLIVVDTLRADHLSLYGYDRETSPAMDAFFRDGIVFEQARSQAGCTFPSVNSLLTSRYPQDYHRSMKQGLGIPESIPTLAEMMQDAGYATAAVSASPIVRANPGPINPDGGFGAGFWKFEDDCEVKLPDGRTTGGTADCVNAAAMELLDELTEPFFLYLHYFEPHDPYQPPAAHDRSLATDDYPKSWVADGTLLPIYRMLYKDGPSVEFDDRDLARTLDLYDEEILYFDSQFELLIERLKRDGLLDSTMVMLASDHGEAFLEHDHLFHCKDLSYGTLLRTPLLLKMPGVRHPGSIAELAQNLDIVPTILDYLGIDASAYDLKGKSLRPLIEQSQPAHRYVFGLQRYTRTVTDGRFKLIYNIKTGEVELFDLFRDPGETTNIIFQRPQIAESLTTVLLNWVETAEGEVAVADRVRDAGAVTEKLRALGYL